MEYKQMIKNIYIFKNGCVAVFDKNGKQMRKFQGIDSPSLMKKIHSRIKRQKTNVLWKSQI